MQVSEKDALIVVDVQNDFLTGTMAIPGAKAIIDPINRLAEIIPSTVIATDWHPVGHVSLASSHPGMKHGDVVQAAYGPQRVFNDHCVQGTWGAELDPDLRLGKAELILRKGYRLGVESNGAFFENDGVTDTGLAGYLRGRGIERIFCTGLARFGCVMQTALGGARAGFTVYMVDDGSMGRPGPADEENRKVLADAGVHWIHSSDILGAAGRAVA